MILLSGKKISTVQNQERTVTPEFTFECCLA
jgi:hypothetical protein